MLGLLLKLRRDSFPFTKERPLKSTGVWDVFVSTAGLSVGKPVADEAGGDYSFPRGAQGTDPRTMGITCGLESIKARNSQ